jgi:molybdate transport system permease protein
MKSRTRAAPHPPAFLWIFVALLLLFVLVPALSVFAGLSGGDVVAGLTSGVALSALRISLLSTTASLAVMLAVGIPTAYALTHSEFKGKALVDSIVDLPIVMPPAVAGVALLLALAPRSPIGAFLDAHGLILPGSFVAVVIAQTFVAMPFFVRSARTAFEEVDPRIEKAASTLAESGLYNFRRIAVPLASRGLVAGAILGWGRALGEFGATLMFAGNLLGITQTLPLAIYFELSENLYTADLLSALLISVSFGVIVALRLFEPRRRR